MDALGLRSVIYRHFVATGTAPTRRTLTGVVGNADTTTGLLRSLHDEHMIVLDDRPHRRGEIRMALPFAAEPTDFRVQADSGAWWANCAWDSLAVVAALKTDARVTSTWSDTGQPVNLTITDGRLDTTDGYVHFTIPAHQWWDDIVLT
jgi:Alkylmercury lyase